MPNTGLKVDSRAVADWPCFECGGGQKHTIAVSATVGSSAIDDQAETDTNDTDPVIRDF